LLAEVVRVLDETLPVNKRSRNTEEEQCKSHAAVNAIVPLAEQFYSTYLWLFKNDYGKAQLG
jgi:hypothetical protein